MDYKKESILLIEKLNKRGITRVDIAKRFGKKPSWITEGLSRGGNRTMYNLLKTMYDQGGPTEVEASTQSGTITMTFEERISELLDDKKTLKESIQLSLNAIQRSQKDELDYLQKNEIHSELILRTMARIVDHLGIENHDRKAEVSGSGKIHAIVEKGKPSGSRGKG